MPLVLEGMNLLAKERPATEEKAIEWFAAFLLKNKNFKEEIKKAKDAEKAAPVSAEKKKWKSFSVEKKQLYFFIKIWEYIFIKKTII